MQCLLNSHYIKQTAKNHFNTGQLIFGEYDDINFKASPPFTIPKCLPFSVGSDT